jgi:hypothetical protein
LVEAARLKAAAERHEIEAQARQSMLLAKMKREEEEAAFLQDRRRKKAERDAAAAAAADAEKAEDERRRRANLLRDQQEEDERKRIELTSQQAVVDASIQAGIDFETQSQVGTGHLGMYSRAYDDEEAEEGEQEEESGVESRGGEVVDVGSYVPRELSHPNVSKLPMTRPTTDLPPKLSTFPKPPAEEVHDKVKTASWIEAQAASHYLGSDDESIAPMDPEVAIQIERTNKRELKRRVESAMKEHQVQSGHVSCNPMYAPAPPPAERNPVLEEGHPGGVPARPAASRSDSHPWLGGLSAPPPAQSKTSTQVLARPPRLPVIQIEKFGGDPLTYVPFMRAFREQVEKACDDPQTRLTHLAHLCVGPAKATLAPYLYSDAPNAYDLALTELRETYGDTDSLVHEWVERLLKKPASFEQYVIDLKTCCVVLTAVGKKQEVVSRIDLGNIAKLMPERYYQSWSFEALRIMDEEGRMAGLWDLSKYMTRCHRQHRQKIHGGTAANDEPTTKPPQASATRPGTQRRDVHATTPTTKPTTKPTTSPTTQDHGDCAACERRDHALEDCETYLGLSLEDRRQLVVTNRLCFRCLRSGHIATNCRSKERCQADGCGRRHATSLHDPHWNGPPGSDARA